MKFEVCLEEMVSIVMLLVWSDWKNLLYAYFVEIVSSYWIFYLLFLIINQYPNLIYLFIICSY